MKIHVLNSGYVELVESMGGDDAVIRNARRCWKSESKGEESDRKLLRHLLRNKHMTPFEAAVFTFDVKAPIFVARQWFRHRIGSYNEESLRYCVAERDFYIPDEEILSSPSMRKTWYEYNDRAFDLYEGMKDHIPKEQARALLPLGTYTRYYWTVNGSSLLNFLRLRMDKHAQLEIQCYARAVCELAERVAPVMIGIFLEEW